MLLHYPNPSDLDSVLLLLPLLGLSIPNGIPKPLDLESISVPLIVQVTVMFLVQLKFGGFVQATFGWILTSHFSTSFGTI